MEEIERMGTELAVERSTVTFAGEIFEQASDSEMAVKSVDRLAAASLLAACRLHDEAVPVDAVAEASPKPKKTIVSGLKKLNRELDLGIPPENPQTVVESFCEELELDASVRATARLYAQEASAANLDSGVNPYTHAASVVYLACRTSGDDLTQKEMADVAGIATVSLRERFGELVDTLGLDIIEAGHPTATPEIVRETDRLVELAEANEWMVNKSRMGVFAGAYLTVAGRRGVEATPDELAEIVGLSADAIRKRRDEFESYLSKAENGLAEETATGFAVGVEVARMARRAVDDEATEYESLDGLVNAAVRNLLVDEIRGVELASDD